MANAVIVIDLLKGFLEEGYPLYCGDKSRQIIPKIHMLLERELEKGSAVFFLCDSHDPDDLEFKMFPPHCVRGTEEAEVIPELKGYAGEVIPKNRFSCFYNTTLNERLEALQPDKLIICGVCTDICVLHTVSDARNRDYEVEVPVDCVASFNEEGHKFALDHMDRILGARLTHTRINKAL
jgi:nicotinamidase-related amidase